MTGRAVHVTGSGPRDRKTTGTPDPVGKVVIDDPMARAWTGVTQKNKQKFRYKLIYDNNR